MKISIKLLTTLLFATLLNWPVGYAWGDEAADRARLEQVKKSIAKLKAQLEATKSDRDKLLSTLEKSEKQIGELSKKAESLKTELDEQQGNLNQLRDERSSLQTQKKHQQVQVSQHINSAYRLGQQSNMRLLLNQQDPSTVTRNLKYYDYLIRARADKIDAFAHTIDRINVIEPEIAYQTQKLEANHRKLEQQKSQLQQAQSARKNTLAKLNTEIKGHDQQLRSMYSDRQRLEQLLNQVSQWLEDIKVPQSTASFADLKGKLPWPTNGSILKNYGSTRVSGKLSWEGMLIASQPGNPVYAVHHGRIIFSDYLRGHGLLIIIDHGSSYMTLYAHNQALYKELGEWVDGGDVIASVGNSGGQQQAALYFELRYKGEPTNPKRWFRQA
ncbi:septal ring factor EnvC (AmiA/AmiB activator) [Alteromonadaceae bacterium 2753L.S.0a.02]|nr:septal ring factor EnvC (AmiA/AmiB activator) [Alteromonadaceae bacterium 2753L.S.0a.02]